jgi:cytoskeleton protein RodZ
MQHTISYGQELKSARERSGMSLQAVADALHLDPQLIEAIEGEHEESLPAPAYVRGYIRAYAQLVRCEPDTLIARYNTQGRSDPDLIASVHSVAAFRQERDARLMWVGTGIVVSLLLIVVGGWLLIENLFLDTSDTGLAAVPPPVADSPFDATTIPEQWQQMPPALPGADAGSLPPITASSDAAGSAPAETMPQAQVPMSATAQEPAVTAVAPTVQAAPVPRKPVVTNAKTGDDTLRLAFDGVSWIQVLDANGERLVYGLFDAGTRPLTVRGQAPFDVTIGDANHVDISINERFVSSEPYIRRDNTARFTIESPVLSR